MDYTKIEDFLIPESLYPKHELIDLDIIRYGVFFRKVPNFNEKNIVHSSNESYHHVALKALAYYELLKLYPDSNIEFESHYGTWQELDLRCSIGNVTKVVVECGDSNVNFDNILNRGLNISEEIWLIPYTEPDYKKLLKGHAQIHPIFSFTRGKHWNFFKKLKDGKEQASIYNGLSHPHATITVGANQKGYYLNRNQYELLEEMSIQLGYKDPTLFIIDFINKLIELNKKEQIVCLSCSTKLNVLDNYCRNCGKKNDLIYSLKAMFTKNKGTS